MTSGQGREGKREQSEWVVGMMQWSVRNRRACRGWCVAPATASACCKPLPQAACRRCRADVAAIAVGGPGGGGGQGQIRDHGAWPMPAWRPRERNHPTRGLLCNCWPDSWPDSARRHVSWACPSRASPPTRGRDAGRCLPGAHAGGITQPAVGTLWAPALGPLPGARQLGVRITLQPARPGYPHPAHSTISKNGLLSS